MKYKFNKGFSLAEVLIAVGIFAVALVFIAGVFPVGIHFTTVSADRTIAAVIADEAFAKVRLYSYVSKSDKRIDISEIETDRLRDFNDWYGASFSVGAEELTNEVLTYPSTPDINVPQRRYCWSALCRHIEDRQVQVTIFINRKAGFNRKYHRPDHSGFGSDDYGTDSGEDSDWPFPVKVKVGLGFKDNELRIENPDERTFINDGYTIVDDKTGKIYRVLERYRPVAGDPGKERIILLDEEHNGNIDYVWVVPPPKTSGRCPCIAVYQRIIRL